MAVSREVKGMFSRKSTEKKTKTNNTRFEAVDEIDANQVENIQSKNSKIWDGKFRLFFPLRNILTLYCRY